MKAFSTFMVFLSFCLAINHNVYCSETYSIDGNRVLLYKVINWWYDCLPEQATKLCGRNIKYQKTGSARVEYNETESTLKLQICGSFAELLSIFKHCEHCFGPTYLECTWLNEKYFGNGKPDSRSKQESTISPFTIIKINPFYGRRIQDIEKDIIFELEGEISGLLNGEIALYPEGSFIKGCPKDSHLTDHSSQVSIKIINSSTGEVLAKYSTVLGY